MRHRKLRLIGAMILSIVVGCLSFVQAGRMTKQEVADFGASVDHINQTADTQSGQAWLSLPFIGVGAVCFVALFFAVSAFKRTAQQRR
ncbi:MAG: hypothetical protein AAB624_01295 [Patescibacteria group bacterium]